MVLHESGAVVEYALVRGRIGRGHQPGAAVACGSGLQGARERWTEPTERARIVRFGSRPEGVKNSDATLVDCQEISKITTQTLVLGSEEACGAI